MFTILSTPGIPTNALQDPISQRVINRITNITKIPQTNSESLQIRSVKLARSSIFIVTFLLMVRIDNQELGFKRPLFSE
jgi:hypothetical protein